MISRRKLIFIILILNFGIVSFAFAQWTPGEPIVPCGGLDQSGNPQAACDTCQLFKLTRNIIDLIMFYATPLLATLFFIIAGVYMMLGGANPGMLSTGKRMFKDVFIGVLIVMLAWLITNTLIQTLVTDSYVGPTGRPEQPFQSGNWWEFRCTP